MNKTTVIIGDADALIALVNRADAHHKEARRVLQALDAMHAIVLFPVTAFAEAITTLQRKMNKPEIVDVLVQEVQKGKILLVPVHEGTMQQAFRFFTTKGSKKNTLFDAIVAAVAHMQSTEAVFSFDTWYTKQGFYLARDVVKR
jgi:predicted nucleic acid-binding protein